MFANLGFSIAIRIENIYNKYDKILTFSRYHPARIWIKNVCEERCFEKGD